MNAMADEVIAGNYTCGVPRSDAFIMLRNAESSDLPWPGFLFGQTPATIWYWCADQVSKFKQSLMSQGSIIYTGTKSVPAPNNN